MAHHGFDGHDGYDSGDDEEDHDDDHHHDTHDTHHHHHLEGSINGGPTLTFNVYHHDPKHGKEAYHLHAVSVNVKGRQGVQHFYHYGSAEHKDEPRGSSLYFLNKTPVIKKYSPIAVIAEKPASVAMTSHELYQPLVDHDERLPPFNPSAPPEPKMSDHYAGFHSPKGKSSAHPVAEKEEDCCRCTIL